MKVLVGLSNGGVNENGPYKMLIVDVDEIEPTKLEWKDLNAVELAKCTNVRVNMHNYNPLKNPTEYLEAEFDVSRLINIGINQSDFQITNVYTNERGEVELFRSVNSLGQIEMHDISELKYKRKYSICGSEIDSLPSFIKREPLNSAYEWWKKRDEASKLPKNRFTLSNFETHEEMPVKLLYHYLIGVKDFELGYHTATDMTNKNDREVRHEYFLFKNTANIKLTESISKAHDVLDEVEIYGNNDPYPFKQKLGCYGATMSLICKGRNYPNFNWNERPLSETNFDKNGIAVTIDGVNGLFSIYNKFEDANCISNNWRLGEYNDFFGNTLTNLIPRKFIDLSQKLQSEKERSAFGHWSIYNTSEWMQTAFIPLSTQYYSINLRNCLSKITVNYQSLFSEKLAGMIKKMGAKDVLEVMKWLKENVKEILQNIRLVKEDGKVQESSITVDQMKSLFTFQKNKLDLPDWLQIYSTETIEKLGGANYLKQIINARGEKSSQAFLCMLAEKIETDQRYALREESKKIIEPDELEKEESDNLVNIDTLTMKRAA